MIIFHGAGRAREFEETLINGFSPHASLLKLENIPWHCTIFREEPNRLFCNFRFKHYKSLTLPPGPPHQVTISLGLKQISIAMASLPTHPERWSTPICRGLRQKHFADQSFPTMLQPEQRCAALLH